MIGADGEQLGIMTPEEGIAHAENVGLDLVEVSPTANPPVCRIMDYGKFKYEKKKKESEARKKQVTISTKEVKFRVKIEDHDFETKVRRLRGFIEEGNKVKVTIMFRGREITHPEIGRQLLRRVEEKLTDIANLESSARMEGRNMHMLLAPTPQVAAERRKVEAQKAKEAKEEKEKEKGKEE